MAGAVLLVMFGALFLVYYKQIMSCFNRAVGEKENLDPYAQITDMKSEKVQYMKNGAQFKTVVTFSDGYCYETHLTNRENGILTYTISIDAKLREEILRDAIIAHNEQVYRATGKRVPPDFIPIYLPTNSPAVTKTAVFSADAWICNGCGHQNPMRIKSCQGCGVTKAWSDAQEKGGR